MKSFEDSSKQHDSVLETKTGPVGNQERPFSIEGRQVIASRYAILGALGRGGMGEVWHAFDLKLRVDVALKSLRSDRGHQDVESLRREVRSAREVISPNVCRIFDLVVEDQQELVSMEYIDGITLADLLQKNGSLEIQKASDIASQFLAGLQAIHQAGLVHRDFKPENVMITRTGRVLVMDFGIAKPVAQFNETISGTPSYMAPEQLEGRRLDPRSDIFAAGVVLAEMIQPDGIRSRESREALLKAIRQEPFQLPDHPWKKIIHQAVNKNPEHRFPSASALARAIEEVTQRSEIAEDRKPYPGLSAFTEKDKDFFFGREQEVETVLKKLQDHHLIAIIGPSGAGKTSFLQAGLIPALPPDWDYIFCTPGDCPSINLSQALVPKLSGDVDLIQKLLRFDDPQTAIHVLNSWRQNHLDVLLIIDRFEELFTLNSSEAQSHYVDLIARAALEADVRVLLVMRDDFLMFCHRYSSLAPIFSDLTGLSPLAGPALRRTLIQPALKCNYRFEDEALMEQIAVDVEKERGALPLMAFAASRLWDKRDRQAGLLTRSAYHEIGGVAGALAQHAEATMERIGADKHDIVREIFRNLITAQGTRAARDTEELLSVFSNRKDAEEVLRALINARLLTSFEVKDAGKSRVEIIHESLLTAWPRLVRWQTQDADSAQLRDQLRQAAQLWQQRGRSQDLLWTGTAYLEFQAWRQRYPGGLSATEEEFAKAMKTRAIKHRRDQRIAIVTIFVVLLMLLAVLANFWQREKLAHEHAVSEAQRAEASKVLALGRNKLANDPTVALAYAIASLEIADSNSGRQFAVEALSMTPPVSIISDLPIRPTFLQFSSDGNHLVVGGFGGVRLLSRDGKSKILEEGFAQVFRTRRPQFSRDGNLITWVSPHNHTVRVWSINAQKEIRQFKMEGRTVDFSKGNRLFLFTDSAGQPSGKWKDLILRTWDFKQAEPKIVGRISTENLGIPFGAEGFHWSHFDIDLTARWIAYSSAKSIYIRSLENLSTPPRLIGEHDAAATVVTFNPSGQQIVSSDANGEIRFWSVASPTKIPLRIIPAKASINQLQFNNSGSVLAVSHGNENVQLWDLTAPPENEPMTLRRDVAPYWPSIAFSPDDRWGAVPYSDSIAVWPLNHGISRVLHGNGDEGIATALDFTPEGKWLAAGFSHGSVYLWPYPTGVSRILWEPNDGELDHLRADPTGRFVGVGTSHRGAVLVSITDGKATPLPGALFGRSFEWFSFTPDGKLAAVSNAFKRDDSGIRIWNLESNEARILDESKGMAFTAVEFAPDGRLFSTDEQGYLRKWDLKTGKSRVEMKVGQGMALQPIAFSKNNPNLMACIVGSNKAQDWQEYKSELKLINLKDKTSRRVTSHGNCVYSVRIDPSGQMLVTGDVNGIVRVGPITGEEPHLLFGHGSPVMGLTIDPNNHWIASSELSHPLVRIRPMPKGQPIQTLPYLQLLAHLRTLTNIRIVADTTSTSGYRTKFEPYRGWEKVPEW